MSGQGDIVDLVIEKPAAGGRMLARLHGQIVLVAGAIPGERVRARLESKRGGVLFATAVDILERSPDRRPPGDDPACGGRQFAHIAAPRQRALKAEIARDAFARIAHLELPAELPVHASPEQGYRMRARLHVQGRQAGVLSRGHPSAVRPAVLATASRRDDRRGGCRLGGACRHRHVRRAHAGAERERCSHQPCAAISRCPPWAVAASRSTRCWTCPV